MWVRNGLMVYFLCGCECYLENGTETAKGIVLDVVRKQTDMKIDIT
jgi:hypothetical protein